MVLSLELISINMILLKQLPPSPEGSITLPSLTALSYFCTCWWWWWWWWWCVCVCVCVCVFNVKSVLNAHTHAHPSTHTQHLEKKKKIFPRKHFQKLSFYLRLSHRASATWVLNSPSPPRRGWQCPGPQHRCWAGSRDKAGQGTCQASYSHVLHISPHHLGASCP